MRMDLDKIEQAPEQGKALIYFRTGLYYGEFQRKAKEIILDCEEKAEEPLELHLFDEKVEYRAVYSEAREAYIEALVSDSSEKDAEKITEKCYLLKEYAEKKIGVVNYMSFDENDMLYLSNYRLCTVEEGEDE